MLHNTLSLRYKLLLMIALLLAVYYPTLGAPFNSLDDLKMVNQLLNIDSISIGKIFIPYASGQYYRPLLYLTFVFDSVAWGLQESFMHLENILLHIGSAVLLFFLTRRIATVRHAEASWFPVVTSMLFGLHPIATEAVSWISGRTDVLAGFFVLASLLLCLQALQHSCYCRGLGGAILLLAGCLSKETALFMLPMLLLLCLLPPREITPGYPKKSFRLFLFLEYFASGVCYLLLRCYALHGGDKIVNTVAGSKNSSGIPFTLIDVARVALKSTGFYFKKLLFPLPLNFGIIEISPHYFWLGLVVLTGICWCLYRRSIVAYLFLASFSLVSPAFILPLLRITWTPLAERYVYIASAPFVIAVALLFQLLPVSFLHAVVFVLTVCFCWN